MDSNNNSARFKYIYVLQFVGISLIGLLIAAVVYLVLNRQEPPLLATLAGLFCQFVFVVRRESSFRLIAIVCYVAGVLAGDSVCPEYSVRNISAIDDLMEFERSHGGGVIMRMAGGLCGYIVFLLIEDRLREHASRKAPQKELSK